MLIGQTILDLEDLTEDDLSLVIKEARELRSRKADSRNLKKGFTAMIEDAKEREFAICNKYTGEVLVADDWIVYDRANECLHQGEWHH